MMADRVRKIEYVIQLRGVNRSKPWVDMLRCDHLRQAVLELSERHTARDWRGRDARIVRRLTDENVMLVRSGEATLRR